MTRSGCRPAPASTARTGRAPAGTIRPARHAGEEAGGEQRRGGTVRPPLATSWSSPRARLPCGRHASTSRTPNGTTPRSGCANRRGRVRSRAPCSSERRETVQNVGGLTPRAGTDGGPTARRQRDPAQASRWRSRSEPSASDERLVVTSVSAALPSFAGATATARYLPSPSSKSARPGAAPWRNR